MQGAFDAHRAAFDRLGVATVAVRVPADLDACDAMVLPGGESTTMSKLLVSSGLFDVLEDRLAGGMAVFGTCAGAILLATKVADGRADQRSFGVFDVAVRRNGYGRQVDSFQTDIDVDGLDAPFGATFIRAPVIEALGDGVEVLAVVDGHPVMVRSGAAVATTFHPELGGDDRLHRMFVDLVDS